MIKKFFDNRYFILFIFPFFIGSLSILSFQPFNITIINFIIFPLFFYIIVYISKKSQSVYRKKPYKINLFLFGLSFGFGFYLSGISWIVNSLTFDENFKVLIPFGLIFIPLFLSLFVAIPTLLIGQNLRLNFYSLVIFAGALSFSDYLRAKLLTGFPWNLWAYSTSWIIEVVQILNNIGLYAYNLIVVTLFTLPIIIFFKISKLKKILTLSTSVLFILSLYIYGDYTLNKNERFLETIENKKLIKVISPNFELKYGLNENEIEERLKKIIRYSEPAKEKATLFIWPEGVFSGYSYNEILIFEDLIKKSFSKNHFIILGSNKLDSLSGQYFNSMLVLDNNLKIIDNYNKRKLVPFGEFLPFENFLNNLGLKKITEGHGSFLEGQTNKNISLDNFSILPLICYEVIFTDLVQKSDEETNLIVNISEDGWFGNTIGPDQHLAKSIFRAVESNTFLIRSANKGISAIIDNKGNIVKRLNRNEAGNIELEIPLIKSNKNKNDLIFFSLLITYLFIFFIYKKKNDK
jgi:apolipoprotein N-acyltransferase|tara:strand:+ start:3216 stop:4775 length:1560 start_codon:yes stop_codon:yes gene_type:complete